MNMMALYISGILSGLALLITGLATIYYIRRANPPTPPSPEEMEEIARERARKAEEDALMIAIWKEAKYLSKEIPEQLAIQNQMAYAYMDQNLNGKKRRKKRVVKFPVALITTTEIWFCFNGKRLPYGTSFYDIKNPANHVCENLQNGVGRTIRLYEDEEYNLFLIANLKTGIGGVPKVVKWQDVHDQLPASKPLAVAIGVAVNNKLVYQDSRTWPHIFVAGSTNMGKSNQVKSWICSLMLRNTPEQVQFYFIDLKRGLALGKFKNIPHCAGFAKQPEEAAQMIRDIVQIGRKRLDSFEDKCEDLIGWNAQFPHQRLPYIYVIIDELFDLMNANPDLRSEMIVLIGEIHRQHRAAGIHDILSTQIINKQVADIQIIGNAPSRCCFSLPGISQSVLVLNNGKATTLLDHPGRCVYRGRGSDVIVQSPWITEREVQESVDRVIAGHQASQEFTPDDLWRVILHNLGGLAAYREVKDACNGQISEYRLKKWLKGAEYNTDDPEGSVIIVEGNRYILAATKFNGAMKHPRRLLSVNGYLPATTGEIDQLYLSQAGDDPLLEARSEESLDVGELEKESE